MIKMMYETAVFYGYANVSQSVTVGSLYQVLTLGCLINLKSGTITDVSCTLMEPLGKKMVREYLINHDIINDYDEIVNEINFRHQGNLKKPLLKAFNDIHYNYFNFINTLN